MILRMMQTKIKFILSSLQADQIFVLQKAYELAIEESDIKITSSLKNSLFLDLTSLFSNYTLWLENSFFLHILCHHLGKEYSLAQHQIQSLVNLYLDVYKNCKGFKSSAIHKEDRAFLFFLIAKTLSNTSPYIVEDIGLGADILNLIKQSTASNPNHDEISFQFSHDLHRECTKILEEISQDYASKPWISDVILLMYHLVSAPEPWNSLDMKQLSEKLYFRFTDLGKTKSIKLGAFQAQLIEIYNQLSSLTIEKNVAQSFIESLKKLDFIYEIPASGKPEHHLISLTQKGYSLLSQHIPS